MNEQNWSERTRKGKHDEKDVIVCVLFVLNSIQPAVYYMKYTH